MQILLNLLWRLVCPFNCSLTTSTPCPSQILGPPPDLPLEIWLEIFQFATYVHHHVTISPLDPFVMKRTSTNVMAVNTPSLSKRTKLSLVLVCRAWRKVTIQMLYEHVIIKSPARASAVLAVLQSSARMPESDDRKHGSFSSSGYGQWTRHVEIYTHARGTDDIRYLQIIFHILQACPNLRILSGTWNHPLPVEFLKAISKLHGPTLQGLYWNGYLLSPPTMSTPEFIGSFQSLRVLDLRNYVGNEFPECPEKSFRMPVLPMVQDLIISTYPSSLAVATALSLPALRNLTVRTVSLETRVFNFLTAFLEIHGPSITSVDLPSPLADSEPEPDISLSRRTAQHLNPDIFLRPNLCPNLTTLTFPNTSPPLGSYIHRSLRRIGFRGVRAESLYPDKTTNTKTHLLSFTPDKYPSLEVVKTVGFLVDAETDSLIKDIFIWWVEIFEKQGIDFLDGEGVLWAYGDPSPECEHKGDPTWVSSSIPPSISAAKDDIK